MCSDAGQALLRDLSASDPPEKIIADCKKGINVPPTELLPRTLQNNQEFDSIGSRYPTDRAFKYAVWQTASGVEQKGDEFAAEIKAKSAGSKEQLVKATLSQGESITHTIQAASCTRTYCNDGSTKEDIGSVLVALTQYRIIMIKQGVIQESTLNYEDVGAKNRELEGFAKFCFQLTWCFQPLQTMEITSSTVDAVYFAPVPLQNITGADFLVADNSACTQTISQMQCWNCCYCNGVCCKSCVFGCCYKDARQPGESKWPLMGDHKESAIISTSSTTQKLRFGAKDPISLQHSVYDIVLDPVTELDDISRFIFELQLRSPQMRYQPELTLTASAEGAILAPH